MFIIKLWLHFKCIISKSIYRLIYGNRLEIGKNVHWRKDFSLMIDKKGKVLIGKNVFFNNNCSVNANEFISIGDRTLFGENVKIYDHNHKFRKNCPIKKQGFKNESVEIGKDCWIGSGTIILKGTKIGDGSVIGAGSVVSGDIPANSLLKCNREYKIIPIVRT